MPRWPRPIAALLLTAACAPAPPDTRAPRLDLASPDAPASAEQQALEHLGRPSWRRGVEDFVPVRTDIDEFGIAHTRVVQLLGGVPVFGGGAVVHVPADGAALSITDGLVRGLSVDLAPELTAEESVAVTRLGDPAARVDLQVLRRPEGDFLTWRVRARATVGSDPSMPVVFVDAHDGREVWRYDNLQTALDRDTHDADNNTLLPGTLVREEGGAATGDDPVDDAHDFAGVTYDYFDQLQGRDSFDDEGATVLSTANYGSSFANAFWDGEHLVYGDGNAFHTHFSAGLDVVAHEYAHAVTEWTAGLIYANESGGINEATSDILGAVVESWDDAWAVTGDTWTFGEDVRNVGALRYMADPPLDGVSIDDYDEYVDGMDVHYSSGVANRAFVDWVTDPEVSMEEGGDIWFRALERYMTAGTTFPEARLATEQAASDLFGDPSPELDAVRDGWDLVDVPSGPVFDIAATTSGISLAAGQSATYTFTPGASAVAVRFTLEASTANADLYVTFGSAPTTTDHDCGSASVDGYEVCTFDPSESGTYHVLVEAVTAIGSGTLRFWEGEPCIDDDQDGVRSCAGDCNDDDAAVSPNAHEICNGIDDDCDGVIDGPTAVDVQTWYLDADRDGFGDPEATEIACARPNGYAADATDCNDGDDTIFPGAQEICDDEDVDEDCDGVGDEPDAEGTVIYYVDADEDGYGSLTEAVLACQPEDGLVEVTGDCDDRDELTYPGAPEYCVERVDRNCDGSTGAEDRDQDGIQACDDCDDGTAARRPGADEVCDGIDNDCNDLVDDNPTDAPVWYLDADGDGFGSDIPLRACGFPDGASPVAGDCNDDDPAIAPGAPDEPGDGVDSDCDGTDAERSLPESGCATAPPPGTASVLVGLLGLAWSRRRRPRSERAAPQ